MGYRGSNSLLRFGSRRSAGGNAGGYASKSLDGIEAFFHIDNMGQLLAGSGTLINSSTSAKTFIDYEGNIVTTNAGELVIEGGRRVDHSDGIDYGHNSLGIEYYDTEADGINPITPIPQLRHLPALTNNAWPSQTTDITDYPSRGNVVNRTVSESIYTHAAAINVAGDISWLYSTIVSVSALTDYTICLWVKMDDDSEPVVASGTADSGGDFFINIGGDYLDASAASDHSITKVGNIYCVMMIGTTLASPTAVTQAGIVQWSNNSDKKFEVYSIGVIEGTYLFPVYIPTTTAATSWDTDDINISSTDNWVPYTMILLCRLTYMATNAEIGGVYSTRSNPFGQIHKPTNFQLQTVDTASASTLSQPLDIGDDVVTALVLNGGSRSLMTSKNGDAYVVADSAYSGAYFDSGTISLFLDAEFPALSQSVKTYSGRKMTFDEMKTWVEANAHNETNENVSISDESGNEILDESGNNVIA